MRHFTRCTVVTAGAILFLGLTATAASAHVTIDPDTAEPGGYAALTFRVPNERDTADTVKLDVRLPADRPLASVSVKPHPGWSYEVKKTKPARPIQAEGGPVTEVASEIIWTADDPEKGIKPGEYDEFSISAGPLPTTADSLTFKALQSYGNGEVVRWIQEPPPNGPEPERPAPTLKLVPAKANATPSTPRPESDPLAGWALGLSAAALLVALASAVLVLRRSRR